MIRQVLVSAPMQGTWQIRRTLDRPIPQTTCGRTSSQQQKSPPKHLELITKRLTSKATTSIYRHHRHETNVNKILAAKVVKDLAKVAGTQRRVHGNLLWLPQTRSLTCMLMMRAAHNIDSHPLEPTAKGEKRRARTSQREANPLVQRTRKIHWIWQGTWPGIWLGREKQRQAIHSRTHEHPDGAWRDLKYWFPDHYNPSLTEF